MLIFIILFFVSCSSSLRFGISQRYYIEKSETERPLDKFVLDKYENIINIDTLNIPLNKFIRSKQYKVYIGVSFSVKANALYSVYRQDTTFSFLQDKVNKDTVSVYFKKYNDYYYSLIYNSIKDNLTYILVMESDSVVVKNKFKDDFLIKKISNEN